MTVDREVVNTLNVGDKVYILSGKGDGSYAGGWVRQMDKLVGNVCTVESVNPYTHACYVDEYGLTFDDRYLLRIEDDFQINDTEFDEKIDLFFS